MFKGVIPFNNNSKIDEQSSIENCFVKNSPWLIFINSYPAACSRHKAMRGCQGREAQLSPLTEREDLLLARSIKLTILPFLKLAKISGAIKIALVISLFVLSTFLEPLYANPQGVIVTGGSVSISQSGTSTQITQTSDRAVINWESFNIANGERVHFQQPGAGSIALNKINPANGASQIFGQLSATGQVWLVNPAGVFFGGNARVDVAGLLATTANIRNEDFMAGRFQFTQSPDWHGAIINEGNIQTTDYGMVALVAPAVINRGVIQARLGKIALASGNEYTIDFYGDQLINFGLNANLTQSAKDKDNNNVNAGVTNEGSVIADGGRILMSARVAKGVVDNVINMKGIAQAKAVVQKGGEIVLLGGNEGSVSVTGKIDAAGRSADQQGGRVVVTAKKVQLNATTVVDASGDMDGGEILIGGDKQGKNPDIQNATTMIIDRDVQLLADALTQGNGGKVIVWSDDMTMFLGNIFIRGGALSGNGGFAEVSGKQGLIYDGFTNALAANGQAGDLLLDPRNITIQTGGTCNNAANSAVCLTRTSSFSTNASTNYLVDPSVINNAASNVILQANNDILFNNNVNISAAGVSLTAQAGRKITVSTNVTVQTNNAAISFTANETTANGVVAAQRAAGIAASIDLLTGSSLVTGGGNITLLINTGAGLGDSSSGNISFTTLNAGLGTVSLSNLGPLANSGIVGQSTSNLITAASVALNVSGASSGTGGIGTNTTPIRITATNLAANLTTQTGGIFISSPTQGINLGSVASLNGITNTTSNTSLTTAGAITDSAASNMNGRIFTVNSGATTNNIVLDNLNNFGTVVVTQANNVTLTDNNAITLGASTISGTLNVNSSGDITDSGNLTVAGVATFAAGSSNNITLDNSNDFSTIAITSGDDVTLMDINALAFNNSTISGNLNITANGNITDNSGNNIKVNTVNKTATFAVGTANDIILNGSANDFTKVIITAANDVTFTDINTIDLGAATLTNGTYTVTANSITSSGTITANSFIGGADNDIDLSFGHVINSANFLSTGGTSVRLTDFVASLDLTGLTAGANSASINITNSTGAITISGNISAASGSSVLLNANSGALTVNNGVNINAAGSSFITLMGTDIALNGTVTNSSGIVTFISNSNAVSLGTDTTNTFQLSNADLQKVTASNVIVNTANTGSTIVSGITNAATANISNFIINANSGAANSLTFNGSDSSFASNLTANAVSMIFDKNLTANNISLAATNGISLTNAGGISWISSTGLSSTSVITSNGNKLTVAGGNGTVILNNASNNFNSIGIISGNDVTLADISGLTFAASTISGNLNVTANGDIDQSGAISVNAVGKTTTINAGSGSVDLSNTSNNFRNVNITTNAQLDLADVDDINIAGITITGSGSATINAGGAITDSGSIISATLAATANNGIILNNAGHTIYSTVLINNLIGDINLVTAASSLNLQATNLATAGGNISITNTTGDILTNPNADITTAHLGDISLIAAGALDMGGDITTPKGSINLTGNDLSMTLGMSSFVSTNAININSTRDVLVGLTGNGMSLIDFELNNMTTGTLNINAGNNSSMTISNFSDPALTDSYRNLNFNAINGIGDINFNAGSSTFGANITANANSNITVATALATNTGKSLTLWSDRDNNGSGVTNLSANLTAPGGINLRGNSVTFGADLALTTTNSNINSFAPITANGHTITFTAGTGNISVTNTGNDFATVNILSSNIAFLSDSVDNIDLGTIDSNLFEADVFGTGNITNSGNITATNVAFYAEAGDVTLNQNNDFDTFDILGGNNYTINDIDGIQLGNGIVLTLTGNLTVTANGAITQGDAILANGAGKIASFSAGNGNDIILNKNNNFSTVAVNGNNVILRDSGMLDLGAASVTGTYTINSTILTDSGVINAAALVATASGGIILNSNNSISNINLTNTGGGSLTFTNNTASTLTIAGLTQNSANGTTINNTGNITTSGALTIAGGSLLNLIASNGTFTLNNALTTLGSSTIALQATDVAINTSTGAIVNGSGNTSIAAAGNVFIGTTGMGLQLSDAELGRITTSNLTLSSGNNGAIIVSGLTNANTLNIDTLALTAISGTSGQITFSGNASTFASNLVANADAGITVSRAVAVASGKNIIMNSDVDASGGALTLSANLTAPGGISLTSAVNGIILDGAVALTTTNNHIIINNRLNAAGNALTLAAGSAGNINLTNAGNDFATVIINSGNDVNLHDANSINIGASTISGDLNITTSGQISQTGAITANGIGKTATFMAGETNDVLLNDSDNDFTTVAVVSGNNINIADTNNLTLNGMNISGSLAATTGNNLIITSGTTVGSGNNINLTATSGILTITGALTAAGDGNVNLTANDLVLLGLIVHNSGNTTINANAGLNLGTSGAGMNISGAELQAIASNEITLKSASGSNIVVGAISTINSANVGTVTLDATTGVGGTIQFIDTSRFSQLIAQGNTIDLASTVQGTNGISLTGSSGIILSGDTALVSIDSTIDLNNAVNGAYELSINAGIGTTLFHDVVSNLGSGTGAALALLSTGSTIFNSTVAANSGITAVGAVIFNNDVTLGNGNTVSSFNGDVMLNNLTFTAADGATFGNAGSDNLTLSGGAINLVSSNAAFIFNSAINGAQALSINTGSEGTTINGSVGNLTPLSSLNVTGPLTLAGTAIITSGNQTYNNAVTLANDVVVTAQNANSNILFDSFINGAQALTINGTSSSTLTFNHLVGGLTALASLDVNGVGTINLDNRILSTAITGNASLVNMTSVATRLAEASNLLATGGTIDVSPGNFGFTANFNISKQLNLVTSGTVIVDNLSNTANFELGGNWIVLNDVTLTNNVTLNQNTILNAANDINIVGTINGNKSLILTSDNNININGIIGGTTALSSLTVNGSGLTNLGANITTQGNTLTFNTAVVLTDNVTLTDDGTSGIIFNNTVNDSVANAHDLRLSASSGTVSFGGMVGGTNILNSLIIDNTKNVTSSALVSASTIKITSNNIAGTYSANDMTLIGANNYTATATAGSLTLGGSQGANITGTVNNISGPAAAAETSLTAGAFGDFFVNGCAVGFAGCVAPIPTTNIVTNDRTTLPNEIIDHEDKPACKATLPSEKNVTCAEIKIEKNKKTAKKIQSVKKLASNA